MSLIDKTFLRHPKRSTFINLTSPLHQYDHDFKLEPCGLEISQFCHDVDPFYAWHLSNLLNHVDGIVIVTLVPNGEEFL